MVGRQQDSVACVQRCAESLGADKLTGSDTVVFAKISRQIPLDDSRPETAQARGHETIGFGDNNVLHDLSLNAPAGSCGYRANAPFPTVIKTGVLSPYPELCSACANEIVLMWVKMVLTTVQRKSLTFLIFVN
jgi:hypothetical protein